MTHIASLPMRADLLSVTGNGQNLSFSVVGSGDMLVDLAQAVTPVVTGATVSSLSGNQLHLSLVGSGQHDVTIQLPAVPPSEVVSSVALSADSGASASDFITNVAAQTVSGTLSAPLAAGDVVKVSLDNGATWQTATAATGAATFSLSGVNLSGSNTLIARVENTAGLASAALTKPYVLDQTPPATPSTPALTATSDNGASNTDNATSVATPTFTGTAEAGSTVTLLDGTATPIGTGVADPSTGAWTITASTLAPGPHSITATATDVAGNVSAASTTPVVVNEVSPPTLMAPASATVAQGAATPITGISVAELGSVSTETFTVTLTDTNGLLSAAGTGVSGSGAKTLTITGSLAAVNSSLATLSVTDATTPSDTITINAVDSFGFAATAQNIPVTVTPATGQTYTLTTGADTVAAGAGANTIMAKTGTLNAGDNINGGTGPTTLQLSGGGAFNLATPATLTNIPTVTAQESTGATAQTITLRAGLNATVNVTPGGSSSGITIIGAANSDVINLGSGNDTVTLGAGETVNSGGGNNIFKVASAALGNVTINGGTIGKNTLSVTGGGTATMGAGITGINTMQLASATTFTANASAGLQIIGSTGADKITAGGAGQILSGGAGADTLTGSSAGNDIFRDTSANLNNDMIVNLLPSDIINFTDLAPATAAITKSTVNGTSTVLTLTSGATTTKITLSGSYNGNFALAADTTGAGGTDLTFVPGSGTPTVTLPTTPVTLATGPVSTNIVATAATLLPADSITGGTGAGLTNQLVLSGGGAFNLAALAKLTNIQVITAQEGQGSTAQTVTLRAGLKNATVNVTADTSGDPSPGITIIGTNDSDVINLGSGNDTVTLGANETVNGGSGADVYHVTRSTIGSVSIKGGTGSNTLMVDGGGTATMTSKITGINAVQLGTTTKFTANATAGLQISGSSAGGDTITLGAPTQSVVAGGPNETVKATVANSGASITGLGANSALEITNGGSVTLNAATDVTIVKLDAVSMLTLNGTAFISAVGSNGADTIRAGGAYQTLTGGAGADTLIGFAGGSDMFRDTAANLNGDTIQNFVNTDSIDLTNLAFAATDTVTTAVSGANTRVTVTAGTTKSVFTMAGSWSSSGFHLASDGANGTLLTHT